MIKYSMIREIQSYAFTPTSFVLFVLFSILLQISSSRCIKNNSKYESRPFKYNTLHPIFSTFPPLRSVPNADDYFAPDKKKMPHVTQETRFVEILSYAQCPFEKNRFSCNRILCTLLTCTLWVRLFQTFRSYRRRGQLRLFKVLESAVE